MKYLLILLCCVVSLNLQSQSITVTNGAQIEDLDYYTFHLYSQDEHNLYAFRYGWHKNLLVVYDKETLKQTASITLPLPAKDSVRYEIEELFVQGDAYKIFYSYFSKEISEKRLELIAFNKAGEKIGETKLIDESEGKNSKRAGSFQVIDRKGFNEFLSYGNKKIKDTLYIEIDHLNYSGNKLNTQAFSINAFDDITYSYIDDDCNLFQVVNTGSARSNNRWSIKCYTPEAHGVREIQLNRPYYESIHLSSIFESLNDNSGRLYIFSPYTLKVNDASADGLYLAVINTKTQALIGEHIIPFVKKGGNGEKTPLELSSCFVQGILPLSNNGFRVVFESRLKTLTKVYGATLSTEYEIGNIISVDMDSSFAVTDIRKIRKNQRTDEANYKYAGFVILNHNDKSYFIYNELEDNLDLPADKMKTMSSGRMDETTITATTVEQGKVVRKAIIQKAPKSTDAILPEKFLSGGAGNELYGVRRIDTKTFLIKISMQE